ncbi:MAG: hypothetical protein HKM93_19495 [Desulfobacteraceae bacterium]|nr:hypothetical protein [Desulfobacteraceae bacterium]
MEKSNHWVKRILLFAGVFELTAGLSHAVMPLYIYESPGFSLLQPGEIDIITLSVFSVGILLVAFGSLSILFAMDFGRMNNRTMLYFVSTQAILWAMRIILELLYPTKVAMFSVEQPTVILVPVFIFLCGLFLLSGTLTFRNMNRESA